MQRETAEGLSAVAISMATEMKERCRDAPASACVSMPVEHVRQIADMLLEAGRTMQEPHGELDPDGFRFWLPLPQIELWRRRAEERGAVPTTG